jgi:hypothetical protein
MNFVLVRGGGAPLNCQTLIQSAPPPSEPVFVDLLWRPVPEFIDPRIRENKPNTLVFSHCKRAFWACFHENWVCNFGHRYRLSAWPAGTKPYLSYWPARLHRLAKSIPRNRFLGSINVYKYGLSTHSIPPYACPLLTTHDRRIKDQRKRSSCSEWSGGGDVTPWSPPTPSRISSEIGFKFSKKC